MKVGDKVKIVKYGCTMWANKSSLKEWGIEKGLGYPILSENDVWIVYDDCSHMVGMEGIIETVKGKKGEGNGVSYALDITTEVKQPDKDSWESYRITKVAWYNEEQLELID